MTDFKTVWVLPSKRAALSTQMAAAEQWGAQAIWQKEHGGIWDFIGSLRQGDIVGVWTCDLLAPPLRKRLGETRRETFRKVAEAIMEVGAKVHELKTGRTCEDRKDLVGMMLDARDAIASVSGTKAGPGRPRKVYSKKDMKAIAGLWFHRKHRKNADRLAAVQAEYPQFTLSDFYRNRDKLEEV